MRQSCTLSQNFISSRRFPSFWRKNRRTRFDIKGMEKSAVSDSLQKGKKQQRGSSLCPINSCDFSHFSPQWSAGTASAITTIWSESITNPEAEPPELNQPRQPREHHVRSFCTEQQNAAQQAELLPSIFMHGDSLWKSEQVLTRNTKF